MNIYCLKGSALGSYEDYTILSLYKLTLFMNKHAWIFVCDVGPYLEIQGQSLYLSRYKGELKHLAGRFYEFKPELFEITNE